jgi:hypothetical protein
MKPSLKFAAVAVALFFVIAAPAPVEAMDDEGHCWACQMCYSDTWWCTSCGTMALGAISGCCGMGGGQTYCVPDYGGFAVNCDSGRACQCDMIGGQCDELRISG